jgi:hypothetical protein
VKAERMLYKRWKPFSGDKTKAGAERTGNGIIIINKGLAFRRRLSGVVCKLPYAALGGNSLGGER